MELKRHLINQTGEKPYECKFCGIKFNLISRVNHHIRKIHTAKRPYECDICAKTFKWNSELKCHLRIHSGEKPYECGICGKAFNRNSDLIVTSEYIQERNYMTVMYVVKYLLERLP